jgi:ferric-dicitrate binding protein FerR (iron transport regulator)
MGPTLDFPALLGEKRRQVEAGEGATFHMSQNMNYDPQPSAAESTKWSFRKLDFQGASVGSAVSNLTSFTLSFIFCNRRGRTRCPSTVLV